MGDFCAPHLNEKKIESGDQETEPEGSGERCYQRPDEASMGGWDVVTQKHTGKERYPLQPFLSWAAAS